MCYNLFFLTRLLTSGILFSTKVNAVFVARLLRSGIFFSIVVNAAFVTRLIVSGIFFSNSNLSASYFVFDINLLVSTLFTLLAWLLYSVFLTTSLLTTLLNLLKSAGTGANLSISNLSTSVFKLATFAFNAKVEVSTCVKFLISSFVN